MATDHQSIVSFKSVFCLRPSSKDVYHHYHYHYQSKDIGKRVDDGVSFYRHKCEIAEFDEPTSPRVGCMGQIKRNKVGITGTKANKFVKLKKIFSGKNLTRGNSERFEQNYSVFSVAELDPPLPVPRRVIKDCGAINLWKRRCGQSLEALQLQQHRFIDENPI